MWACSECGNDEPAQGSSLCLGCLEAGAGETPRPGSATPTHETPGQIIRRLTAERDEARRDLEATGGVLALRTAALGRMVRRLQRERALRAEPCERGCGAIEAGCPVHDVSAPR